MIIKNEFLGLSRCFLIPNMSKLYFGEKEVIIRGTEKNWEGGIHLRENSVSVSHAQKIL